MQAATETVVPAGTVQVGGKAYMHDAKGHLVPIEAIKPADKLQDETVRKIIGYATDLSAQIGRFKEHTFNYCRESQRHAGLACGRARADAASRL